MLHLCERGCNTSDVGFQQAVNMAGMDAKMGGKGEGEDGCSTDTAMAYLPVSWPPITSPPAADAHAIPPLSMLCCRNASALQPVRDKALQILLHSWQSARWRLME